MVWLWLAIAPCGFGQLTHGQPPKLVPPFTRPIVANPPVVKPAPGFKPQAPAGFAVSLFASGFREPRYLAVAPDGDLFVADTAGGKVWVVQDPGDGKASEGKSVFADGLKDPFGIAFRQNYVYVGNTNEVIRFPYDPKTSRRLGEREHILDLPNDGMHFTRTLVFSRDGKKMYVSAGSDCNACVEPDSRRAAILVADPDGKNWSVYASGLRNAVGLAINPDTGELWADVNERDMLGDNLPPDYFTEVRPRGFYGWPYSYIGKNLDDRVNPQRPDLVAKGIIPDVLLGPHIAPLQGAFYTADQFPAAYQHGAFIAEHGSWNRSVLNGYAVVFIPFKDGKPSAAPTPFLTGFAPHPNSNVVNGRPVGVAVAKDGSLFVSDDGGRVVWRVSKTP
jgi:glucose/arabinose dehydrogenase